MTTFVLHVAKYNMPKMAYDTVEQMTYNSREYDIGDLLRFPEVSDTVPVAKMQEFIKRFGMEYRIWHETDVWGENGRMYELHKLKIRVMNETQSVLFQMEFSEFLLERG